MLDKLVEIQLETNSRDQGWADDREAGSWSWFEIIVLDSPEKSVPKIQDGLSLVWLSHYNSVGDKEYASRIGRSFGRKDDIFRGLEVGNALAVRVCVRFPKWENNASEGRLIFKVSDKDHITSPIHATPAAEVKYREAVAQQISKLAEGFDGFLDGLTPAEAPPAYSALRDYLPKEPVRADQAALAEKPPLKVMAFDGGGVRGISSLYILQAIMAKVSPNQPDLKPCQYFDMIAGTSTGGLIAIMLGRLQMSIPECIEAYTSLASSIFSANKAERGLNKAAIGSWYRADDFERAVKALIKKKTGDENALMRDPDSRNKCKVFVVATESQAITTVHQIRTYPTPLVSDPFANCKIWQAARATSAGPLYLPSITINNIELVDGGFGNNNPAPLLLAELAVVYGDPKIAGFGVLRPLQCFLSIGTGMQPIIRIDKQPGGLTGPLKVPSYIWSVGQAAIALATSSEAGHQFAKSIFTLRGNIYFRFNAGVKKGDDWMPMITLDDWKGMPELVEITKKYLLGETERIQQCASTLNT
ncbi:hypothetical protein H0H81_011001, partial [Sphagnurus paluster]